MLVLEASTRRSFHEAVHDVAEAINAAGGWVVTHQFFSNRLASIAFEIPASALGAFAASLADLGVTLHQPVPDRAAVAGEIAAQLSITFVQDGPDIRREVPAFG
ncbi:hypothetical protein [Magnetospirillum fulvum]|uniref:Uncharacterized protein n=1 Tax=Magnetospirillum fulvum TaxID=1082 RepID=A0A1H6I7H3_MAGFU|nr:hypothetical protein [Magnetospirillum fulvum]SEH44187.1 hypothetical protein SAMN04244559_02344 [Magnetospirillum fulvum]